MIRQGARKMIAFGPIPSRRLGRSLGINNVPPKTCSYSCVYCQLGRTTRMTTERRPYREPSDICGAVADRVRTASEAGESIDALTFVPDGEPTLDRHLGEAIEALKPIGKRIAVITNASLLRRTDVRRELGAADWVSVKVDAAGADAWRDVNRPHRRLDFDVLLDGLLSFAEAFDGVLATETMLVEGINDRDEQIGRVAAFVGLLKPATAYLSAAIRPPAETWAHVPATERLLAAYTSFAEEVGRVELLTGDEGEAFSSAGGARKSLLAITSVHPMRSGRSSPSSSGPERTGPSSRNWSRTGDSSN